MNILRKTERIANSLSDVVSCMETDRDELIREVSKRDWNGFLAQLDIIISNVNEAADHASNIIDKIVENEKEDQDVA